MKIPGNFVFLLLLMLLSGCVSFSGENLPTIDNIATDHGTFEEPAVNKLDVAYSYLYGNDPADKDKKRFEDEFIATFDEYDRLSLVAADEIPADQGPSVKLEVQLVDSITKAGVFSAFLAGLSLDMLPTWETRTYTVNSRVTSLEGKVFKYKLVDSMKTVRWLPLFVATPAKNMFTVGEKIRKNIWRNLILKMQEDKILPER